MRSSRSAVSTKHGNVRVIGAGGNSGLEPLLQGSAGGITPRKARLSTEGE